MKKLLMTLLCVAGLVSSRAEQPSSLPLGSEEKYWSFAQANATRIIVDVKTRQDDTWSGGLAAVIPYSPDEGPVSEVAGRRFSEYVEQWFSERTDAELRQYDEFKSVLVVKGIENSQTYFFKHYTYMLVERDGKLELPDSILDPTLTFETSGFSFTFEGLFKAEIVLREKGREVERIASKPTGRAGVDLVVASGGRLHIPAQYALGVEGEIILYYSDGSKQEFDLTTGQPVQIELRITPALIAAEGEQKASNHGVKITVMHTNGQPFILECSDNLANWQELQAYPYPEDEEVFVDGEETSHRFYRVRVIE